MRPRIGARLIRVRVEGGSIQRPGFKKKKKKYHMYSLEYTHRPGSTARVASRGTRWRVLEYIPTYPIHGLALSISGKAWIKGACFVSGTGHRYARTLSNILLYNTAAALEGPRRLCCAWSKCLSGYSVPATRPERQCSNISI